MNTADYFRASLDCAMPKKLGLLTGYQAACWLDCVSNIRVCCAHILCEHIGTETTLPDHWQNRVDRIKADVSLAKIQRMLKAWKKHTHHGLNVQTVQHFLWEVAQ